MPVPSEHWSDPLRRVRSRFRRAGILESTNPDCGRRALHGPVRSGSRDRCGDAVRFAAVLAALCGPLLAGGCDFKPLSLDWNWAGRPDAAQSPRAAAGSQTDAPENAAAEPLPAEVQAGQDDLARRVREYADRLELARREREQQPVSAPPRPPSMVRYEQWAGQPAPPAPGQVLGPHDVTAAPPVGQPTRAEPPVRSRQTPQPIATTDSPPRSEAVPNSAPPSHPPAATSPAVRGIEADPGRAVQSIRADSPSSPPVILASAPLTGLSPPPHTASAGPRSAAGPATSANAAVVGRTEAAAPQPESPDTMADALAAAERAARERPDDFRAQLQLRTLYLAAGRTQEAQAPWPAGPPAQQRTLAAWVEAGIALGRASGPGATGEPAADASQTALDAVERLRAQLAVQAPLKVRAVRLASRVDGFGVVTPFASEVYRAGQWVIVYCELDNLTSRVGEDGLFRSELSLRLEVLSVVGRGVLEQEDKQVVDQSLNQRRDFFLARRLRLPAGLSPGHYVLRVAVEDQAAAKVGESMLRFQVQ